MGLVVFPPNSYVEALTPVPKNVTIFGEKVFKDLIKVKEWVIRTDPNPT